MNVLRIPSVPFCKANNNNLFLGIVRPDPLPSDLMPAAVLLHGGAWLTGSREDAAIQAVAEQLTHRGFFTISPDYRLSKEAIFPAQICDVKAVVRWMRAHAEQYQVDPSRIGAFGYSAGGHLAALLGTTSGSGFERAG